MKTVLSPRIQKLNPSPTFALDEKVKDMQKKGIDIINLGIGEPDFDTPVFIRKEAIRAINEGFTHYTQTAGIPELRKAISEKFKKENNIDYQPSQIIVGSGSKPLLYFAFQALCEKGREVVIPVPTWSSYVEQVKLSGTTPVFLPLEPPFKLTAKAAAKKITAKTSVILLNSPSNPTGAIIEKGELKKIADLANKFKIWVISDEIYEKIIFGGKHVSIASLAKNIYERTITVNGFSKTYAMTGWRIGYAGGPQEVITAMSNLQGHVTANASSISQMAAYAALTGAKTPVRKMVQEFTKRRDFLIREIGKIPQLESIPPEGSFFFFIGINKLGKKYATSNQWCEALLEKKRVAVIPGEAFFKPGFFRISFAVPLGKLKMAVIKINEFVNDK